MKTPKSQIESFYPNSQKDWRNWLKINHESQKSIWLVYYKTSTKIPSLSWSEAVDEALCFGWIDSTKKTIDQDSYRQYFSKRKAKSNWSKINKDKVAKLIENKQMTKAGLESIEIAKQNGSWTFLDEVEALVIPQDLKEELAKLKGSKEYFESLSNSNKKILLYWVISAKRRETRQKRILEIVECAGQNLMPKALR